MFLNLTIRTFAISVAFVGEGSDTPYLLRDSANGRVGLHDCLLARFFTIPA